MEWRRNRAYVIHFIPPVRSGSAELCAPYLHAKLAKKMLILVVLVELGLSRKACTNELLHSQFQLFQLVFVYGIEFEGTSVINAHQNKFINKYVCVSECVLTGCGHTTAHAKADKKCTRPEDTKLFNIQRGGSSLLRSVLFFAVLIKTAKLIKTWRDSTFSSVLARCRVSSDHDHHISQRKWTQFFSMREREKIGFQEWARGTEEGEEGERESARAKEMKMHFA